METVARTAKVRRDHQTVPILQRNGNPLVPPMVDVVSRALKQLRTRSDPRWALGTFLFLPIWFIYKRIVFANMFQRVLRTILGSEMQREHALEETLAQVLVSLRPVRPDIIRAVRAGSALKCCGRAFRKRTRGSFRLSFPTVQIDEFWSHSWHGNTRNKIVTAAFLCNGRAAPLIATLCAIVAAALFVAGILPMRFQEGEPGYPVAPYWGKAVGLFSYAILLFLWQPRKTIFLDILCINQYDNAMKAAALFSMPAFLKASDSLLVLWDPSYTKRLWCLAG